MMIFREDVLVAGSEGDKPGVIPDYDDRGNLGSVKVLRASCRISEAQNVESRRIR